VQPAALPTHGDRVSAPERGFVPASVPSLPVRVLRVAVDREVAHRSLRRAAAEVGVSPNGLRHFLGGAFPRLSTRLKLERWLAANATPSRPPAVGQLVRLLHELAADLPTEQAGELALSIGSMLEEAYTGLRLSPPAWVRELARQGRARVSGSKRVSSS